MKTGLLLSLLGLAIAWGCGHWEPAPVKQQPGAPSHTAAQSSQRSATDPPQQAAKPQAPSAAADKRTQSMEKAQVGMGKRGRKYGGGIITEPIRARFRAEERISLLSVDHALNLFKAEHERLPKSHEEFMEKIIQFNKIELPPLPPGDDYWYDAEQGQLMVRHSE